MHDFITYQLPDDFWFPLFMRIIFLGSVIFMFFSTILFYCARKAFGKAKLVCILLGALVLLLSFVGIGGSGIWEKNHAEADEANFHSWISENYNLKLSQTDENTLLTKHEVVVKQDDNLQKLTLENYKDGVVIMNDGKALKQK